jgi:hypothetical protein
MAGPEGGEKRALYQLQFPGTPEGLNAVFGLKLAEGTVHVSLGRVEADHEPIGDLLVRKPLGDQPQDLQFTSTQRDGR